MTTSPTATASPLEPIHLNHCIDPTVDCVFKALFGSEDNKELLIDFLNSILKPASPIVDVTLLNPTNDKTRIDDKETSVDVKAKDASGAIFQVDVQLLIHEALPERMLFNWATLYSRRLVKGEKYHLLRPVTSIWVLRRDLWRDDMRHHHRFEVLDKDVGLPLSDHLSIHTLELSKWRALAGSSPSGEDLWVHFLRDGHDWQTLPAPLSDLPQMRQAMTVLKKFSDDELAYDNYLCRLDRERVQLALEDKAKETAAALAESERKIAVVQAHMEQAEAQLQQTQAQIQQAEAQIQQAEAQLQQAQAKAQQAEAQLQQAQAKAQQAEAQAQEEAARAQQEAARAQQEAAHAQQEAARAQQEAAARADAEWKLAEVQSQAQQAQANAQQDTLRQSLRMAYEVRFGTSPPALLAALATASPDQLAAWFPHFITASSASEIVALVAA